MKRSETLDFRQALSNLWDEDPDMYEQLLVHRALEYLPVLLDKLHQWVREARIDEGVLRIRTSSPIARQELNLQLNTLRQQLNTYLHAELVRLVQVY